MPFVVGLTGGIGSGKSTVADYFAALGVPTISSDQLARDVVKPETQALEDIVQYFGAEVINPDGTLNRSALREAIFHNETDRIWLETLLHPLIAKERDTQIASTDFPYVVVEIPLLLEKNLGGGVDRILVVDTPESLQKSRVVGRDQVSRESVEAVMQKQVSAAERRAGADDIIDNSGDLESLRSQVQSLHEKYLQLAAQAV